MEVGVIALKTKSDKSSIKTSVLQGLQVGFQAIKHGIKPIDCIVTFGGVKDILRSVKELDARKRFTTLLIYSPSQICKDELEFRAFEKILYDDYQITVRYVRSNF